MYDKSLRETAAKLHPYVIPKKIHEKKREFKNKQDHTTSENGIKQKSKKKL